MMGIDNSTHLLRTCTKCGQAKPATTDFFRAEKRTRVGLNSRCIECELEYKRQRRVADPGLDHRYYEANKHWLLPKMNERQRERRKESGAEVRAVAQKWREKNREIIQQHQRDYYARNRRKENQRLRDYYAQNPIKRVERLAQIEAWRRAHRDRARSYVRNRRARIRSVGGSHTAEDVARILDGQKGHCWWCSKKIPKGKHHVDHRIPIARGGTNGPENLVISCASCNLKKNRKMPWEMDIPRLF